MAGESRLRRGGRWLLAAACLLALAPGRAEATPPGANGAIAFSAFGDIHTIRADGSGLRAVVRPREDDKRDWHPAWSPDGATLATSGQVLRRLASGGTPWTGNDLHLFGADGSAFTRLSTPREHYSGHPAWSPDGAWIAYDSDALGDTSISIVRSDGAGPRLLVAGAPGADAFDPAWSPDGRWIVFARGTGSDGSTDLWVVRPDGSGLRRLLERPGQETGPSWSPDGSAIAFSGSDPRGGAWAFSGHSIYALPVAGGAPVRLTTAERDASPAWSPDGTRIAFQRDANNGVGDDDTRVWVMAADGSGQRALTDRCGQCDPDWQRLVVPGRQPVVPGAPAPAPSPAPGGTAAIPALKVQRMTMSETRFRRRALRRIKVEVRLSAHAAVRLSVRRASARRVLHRTTRRLPAGRSQFKLSSVIRRRLAAGRYTLTVQSLDGVVLARSTFRVLRAR